MQRLQGMLSLQSEGGLSDTEDVRIHIPISSRLQCGCVDLSVKARA